MRKNYWESKNIRIRALENKDLEMYLEQRNSPDSLGQWLEGDIMFPQSENNLRKTYSEVVEEFNKDDKRVFIIETFEEKYAGEISVWYTKRNAGVFRYGIYLDEEYRGRGYGRQALIIVIDYYFNELNYQKASPTVYSYNKNSRVFHEKFGFVLEGRIRNDIYTRGEYHDMFYYGMLKDEFNKLYKHDFMN